MSRDAEPALDGGNNTSSNIFVRFKQHVDSNIASGVRMLLGSPTSPSASYSPAALCPLPRPTPSDLPADRERAVFTPDDAFEYLLAVAQSHPPPSDVASTYEQRMLQHMFSADEPPWLSMRRLESQRPTPAPAWGSLHRELDQRAAQVWSAVAGQHIGGDIFDTFDRALKQFEPGHSYDDDSRRQEPGAVESRPRRPPPDTFDELFSSLSSTLSESERSWDAFLNAMTNRAATSEIRNTPHTGGNETQVESRDEYVDRFGYLHTVVARKTLDKDGREIGSHTQVTVRPADPRASDSPSDDGLQRPRLAKDGSADSKPGWFWK
ncbi:hypothetical protein CDD83_6828 [Cordyceps sp. RAO-2017]|nr:hypothetical protein CDD83_6828 [Cordyceps sp. RAO-2017]